MTKIVVLGGNFGGMTSAFELKRKLKDDTQVVVVSRQEEFVYSCGLTDQAVGAC